MVQMLSHMQAGQPSTFQAKALELAQQTVQRQQLFQAVQQSHYQNNVTSSALSSTFTVLVIPCGREDMSSCGPEELPYELTLPY